ncbi:cyclin dependent kinase 11B pitslre isoform X2 [Rhodnius prolixus]|uniref:cyclin dependent kinase 11B pitslre isoform X2 n=1 Tax=Rhodnius prolixus TaxID=13249 RepID=UPI003D1891F0
MSYAHVMDVDDQIEDGEIKRSPPVIKEPSLESLSLSDEDAVDPLEIKPPQAHVHKRSRKSKHSSSSKRHGSSTEHRKKHHHSRSHRDERHHHHRERNILKEEHGNSRDESSSSRSRRREHEARREERERARLEEQRLAEERLKEERLREEKERLKREEIARKNKEMERDLRDKLEKRRHQTKERDKEKEERDMRRQRLMEAERVKETYKKDIEERRMRREARERSRSRERKLAEEQAEAAAQAAANQAEMEKAGLVVVSDESRSPIIMDTTMDDEDHDSPPSITPAVPPLVSGAGGSTIDKKQVSPAGMPRITSGSTNGDRRSSDSGSPASSSTDTDSDDDDDDSDDSAAGDGRGSGADSTPPPPDIKAEDGHEEMELEKDTLPPYLPAIQGCRSVEEFQCLNRIEEGTYGVVYRARDKRTDQIVALKRLKMEKEKEGFPITSLREINTLLKAQHPNIVTVREIVVGSNMDKIFIVMDYVEHDLKSLMETMKIKKQAFIPGEVKCLMQQLLRAVAHLHDNWILHRDLKASNLLLSHKGVLKVGDFGLAREYGSPLKPYTPIVVTLWYRAPELLLGAKEYSTPIDMWSVGCIFAELMTMEPLFTGKSEQDQLNKIFKTLGTPNERIWPGYNKLPAVQKMTFAEFPVSTLRSRFKAVPTEVGLNLLNGFLTYNPAARLTAESALSHEYFTEIPLPIDPAMFPTWPAKSEGHKIKKVCSPKPPSGGRDYKQLEDTDEGFHMGVGDRNQLSGGPGFSLKF